MEDLEAKLKSYQDFSKAAVFDAEGKLIGITTFGVGDKGNLNFAVSLDEAFPLLEAVK